MGVFVIILRIILASNKALFFQTVHARIQKYNNITFQTIYFSHVKSSVFFLFFYFETAAEFKSPVKDVKLYLNDDAKPEFYLNLMSYPALSNIVISHDGQSMNNLSYTKLSIIQYNTSYSIVYIVQFDFLSKPSKNDFGNYYVDYTYRGIEESKLFGRLFKLGIPFFFV